MAGGGDLDGMLRQRPELPLAGSRQRGGKQTPANEDSLHGRLDSLRQERSPRTCRDIRQGRSNEKHGQTFPGLCEGFEGELRANFYEAGSGDRVS
jgi:hypothetical protein